MQRPDYWDMFIYIFNPGEMQAQLGDTEGPLDNVLYQDFTYPFVVNGEKGSKWDDMWALASMLSREGVTIHISNATGKPQLFLGDLRPNVVWARFKKLEKDEGRDRQITETDKAFLDYYLMVCETFFVKVGL